jgi:hypothetical protein
MLESQDYVGAWDHLLAWGAYIAAALLLLFALWWFSRRWQRDTRHLLLALLAVVLLTPAPVPGHGTLAPAMIFILMGGVTGGAEVMAPVLVRLSLLALAAVLAVVLEGFWWRHHRR